MPRTTGVARRGPARRTGAVAALTIALITGSALVWQASYSAFSATTLTPVDNWAAGSVALGDDDTNSALFTVTGLRPGATGTRCIVVTSTGSIAAGVRMYATAGSFAQTNGLADAMTLTVTQGTTTGANCAGFTADAGSGTSVTGSLTSFSTSYTGFGAAFGTWTTTGAPLEKKTYQITYSLSSSAGNAQQNGSAAIGFTWEAQNT